MLSLDAAITLGSRKQETILILNHVLICHTLVNCCNLILEWLGWVPWAKHSKINILNKLSGSVVPANHRHALFLLI